jgi:glucose-6-phosphate 1-dehydrogenase
MDHYLARDGPNILMFRFANSIFEPLDRRYIDHIQITVAETLGVEHRQAIMKKQGCEDMFQNHIFQLLALTAMEPPSIFEAEGA